VTPQQEFVLNVLPWVVVFLPLAGFTVLALLGDWIKRDKEERGAGILACVTVVLAFACSVAIAVEVHELASEQSEARTQLVQAYQLKPRPEPYVPYGSQLFGRDGYEYDWINVAGLRVPFALLLDPLSAVMLLVVTGIGSLIHIYSLGYMEHDEERVRYFSYLNLFTFFMLVLVMGASLPLMFVGWEGVGLCSYLLIGFWFKKQSASDAGKKAFIVNRIGDAGLLLGMILAFQAFGTLDFIGLTEEAAARPAEAAGAGVLTAIALLLFVGACGKSAQIPLHVWLPDAMEGPTPVSALIHAATMVTAGVYMVARLGPLYLKAPLALAVVAGIGAATALMAASVALVQTDIKKVLAYSTVSQLGYMFLACGVGAFGVGVFHLFTHAFFKALLFLGSGSVIHAMSGEQDMRRMGGLWRKLPWTFATFAVGTLAIAGIGVDHVGLAGYFSKEEILLSVWNAHHPALFWIAVATAGLTAFYMTRLVLLTFFGAFRGGHEAEHHLHESPWVMLAPLVLLAIGSLAAGYVHVPAWVRPSLRLDEIPHEAHQGWLPWLALAVVVTGMLAAYYLYVMFPERPARIRQRLAPVQRVLEAKWGFDDAFNWVARRVVVDASSAVLWQRVDAGIIDGLVNGAGRAVAVLAQVWRPVQTGLVRGYVLLILGGAVALMSYLLWMQP
jgi:NADH-quinone oxidoreductase subunit L